MQLDRPAPPGDRFVNEQNVGQLLVIDVLEPAYNVQTENGPADCIRCNVYVITPQGTVGAQYLGTLLFGKVLFSRLVQSQGRKVVGVLTGQPGVKVQGKNVPYDLDDPTDAMYQAASQAMTQLELQRAPQQQPATQVPPWGGQQQGPPPGWGQQPQPVAPAAQPPAGWGAPPAPAGPWGQQPAPDQQWGQQQLPAPQQQQPERPPWETDQPAAPPWGAQQ